MYIYTTGMDVNRLSGIWEAAEGLIIRVYWPEFPWTHKYSNKSNQQVIIYIFRSSRII